MIDEYIEEYGHCFVKLVDSRVTKKTFEFDRVTLCPTAECYCSLVDQAKINPKIMNYLSRRWSEGTIENLSNPIRHRNLHFISLIKMMIQIPEQLFPARIHPLVLHNINFAN
jgi:hypothetical protein